MAAAADSVAKSIKHHAWRRLELLAKRIRRKIGGGSMASGASW
jgi:hypothetical protein